MLYKWTFLLLTFFSSFSFSQNCDENFSNLNNFITASAQDDVIKIIVNDFNHLELFYDLIKLYKKESELILLLNDSKLTKDEFLLLFSSVSVYCF